MAEVVRYRVKVLAHRSMQQVMDCLGVQFGSKPAQGRLVNEYILRNLQGMKARGSYQRKRGSLQGCRSLNQRPPQTRAAKTTGNRMLNNGVATRTLLATAPPR